MPQHGQPRSETGADRPAAAEFDRFRDSYEVELDRVVGFAGQDSAVYVRAKVDAILDVVAAHLGEPRSLAFLDVGCGTGIAAEHLLRSAGSVSGVDVSSGMIERARATAPAAAFLLSDGDVLPYETGSFDVTFAMCVVHHVPVADRPKFMSELARVTRSGGLVVLAEHNPLNPVTRAIVNRCAFDEDAVLLGSRHARALLAAAGAPPVETRYVLLLPWRNRVLLRAERLLDRLPIGAQYVSAGRKG